MEAEGAVVDKVEMKQLLWYGHLQSMQNGKWPLRIYIRSKKKVIYQTNIGIIINIGGPRSEKRREKISSKGGILNKLIEQDRFLCTSSNKNETWFYQFV